MLRSLAVLCVLLGTGAVLLRPARAQDKKETVDVRIRRMEASGDIKVVVKGNTTDACDKSCDITFTSTSDGDVVVKPGETKYFKIDKDKDDYTRSGGYYWKCCGTEEKSRIKGATYIKVVRKEDTGACDQFWVELQLGG